MFFSYKSEFIIKSGKTCSQNGIQNIDFSGVEVKKREEIILS